MRTHMQVHTQTLTNAQTHVHAFEYCCINWNEGKYTAIDIYANKTEFLFEHLFEYVSCKLIFASSFVKIQ